MNRHTTAVRTGRNDFAAIDRWLLKNDIKRLFMVCDGAVSFQKGFLAKIAKLAEAGLKVTEFSGFEPNPRYESAVNGTALLRENGCGAILAIGGGSALDVAKCVRLFSVLHGDGSGGSWLGRDYADPGIPFLAIPTTAGTGSEATRYAVVYYKGEKQSVTSPYCLPDTVILEPGLLRTLPLYQRKATAADALCHAIESYWSVNSTAGSREFAAAAIRGVLGNIDGYLSNTAAGNREMLKAAHLAGKAINVTQTTAGHAMCYKITSLFGASHGHAALLCDRVLYRTMAAGLASGECECVDPRGAEYLRGTLDELGVLLGGTDAASGALALEKLFGKLELAVPEVDEEQIGIISEEVNPVRLKNHPVKLSKEAINGLYHEILRVR